MDLRSIDWRAAAYDCCRLAAHGNIAEAEAKWRSLNDEIDRTLSSVPSGKLPAVLEDLRHLVTEVSGWNGSGGHQRWVFSFHHAFLG